MPKIEKTKSKNTIWAFVKDFFWECDNIGEETKIKGNTPEDTALLLKTMNNADKTYNVLNSSNNVSPKGGKCNSGKDIVEKVEANTSEAVKNANKKVAEKMAQKSEDRVK